MPQKIRSSKVSSAEYFPTRAFGSAADVILHQERRWLVVSIAEAPGTRLVICRAPKSKENYENLSSRATELARSYSSVSTPHSYGYQPDSSATNDFRKNKRARLITGRIDPSTI